MPFLFPRHNFFKLTYPKFQPQIPWSQGKAFGSIYKYGNVIDGYGNAKLILINIFLKNILTLEKDLVKVIISESHSVVSNSLQPYGLYSPWNSPGQSTGVGILSLLQ